MITNQELIHAIASHCAMRSEISRLWVAIEQLFKDCPYVIIHRLSLTMEEILHEVNSVSPDNIFVFTEMADGGLRIEFGGE